MSTIDHPHRHLDVACELGGAEAGDRVLEWHRLRVDYGVGAEPIPGGVRLWLRADASLAAADLVRREASCCGFLDLHLEAEADRLRLDLSSPAPDAGGVIAGLTGIEPGPPGGERSPG